MDTQTFTNDLSEAMETSEYLQKRTGGKRLVLESCRIHQQAQALLLENVGIVWNENSSSKLKLRCNGTNTA
jgi:hypothetical protein